MNIHICSLYRCLLFSFSTTIKNNAGLTVSFVFFLDSNKFHASVSTWLYRACWDTYNRVPPVEVCGAGGRVVKSSSPKRTGQRWPVSSCCLAAVPRFPGWGEDWQVSNKIRRPGWAQSCPLFEGQARCCCLLSPICIIQRPRSSQRKGPHSGSLLPMFCFANFQLK